MKSKLLLAAFCLFSLSQSNAQTHLLSYQSLGVDQASTFKPLMPQAIYNVETFKITYNTVDVDGSPTVASGAVVIPKQSSCDTFSIVTYAHGTVLEKEDVPSRNNQEATIAKVAASVGAVSVAPDYLGLGDNPGLHPYVHAESEATATIDAIRAARELLDTLGKGDNGEVFLAGYSQGGHAAMATAKYIQDNNLFSEFDVIGAAPASGPYNLSGTQAAVLLSDQPYSNPGYVCYVLFAMERVYGNIYNSYDEILKSPYDTLIPPYFDGTYNMSVVNNLLPDTLSGFLQDSVLANFKNDSIGKTHPIWQALLANDNYDWKPDFPIEMYYCTQDEQVDYHNSLIAEDSMNAKGATSVIAIDKGAYSHGVCVVPSLQDAMAFFLTRKTGCNIGIEELEFENLEVYPNPVSNTFTVSGSENPMDIELINAAGVLVKKKGEVKPNGQVDISNLPTGIYFLKLQNGNHFITKQLIKN
ncbi:T9SS type A sorting domain-containing protein [Owenweeksia hongkongensis]|uniref:T9SS type A sorting domain-containing protein n=1 Tax=Owenweeksia hongkongensis TaxID=253245 RepID=UPI003A958595